MPMPSRFNQPCPTCGRQMRISVELLGRDVACQHCHAEFVAGQEPAGEQVPPREQVLMDRVEEMLRQATPEPDWVPETLGFTERF